MKIYIEYDLTNESGKGKFVQRLTKQWDKTGVEWSDKPEGCDVRLAIKNFRTNWEDPTVLRIDGSYPEADNGNKIANIKKADAVIWQTEFCKRTGHKVFGVVPKKEYVIFNGVDPEEFSTDETGKNKIGVLLMAKWEHRPSKRLKEMIDIATHYADTNKNVRFYVVGDAKRKEHPAIEYCGHLNRDGINKIFAKCRCMLNMAYFDWCPNAVVEALVAGLPVICAAGHGVAEIVKDSGIVLNIENLKHDRIAKACRPPRFDYEPVYRALDDVWFGGRTFPVADHLNIKTIAEQYYNVLKEVCDEHTRG